MSGDKSKEFAELMILQADGSLDEASRRRLRDLLRDDRAVQALYVEHCQMQAMLAWEHGALPGLIFEEPADCAIEATGSVSSTRNRWLLLAIAASAVLVIGASWLVMSSGSRDEPLALPADWASREIVAKLAKSHGARMSVGSVAVELAVGDPIRTAEYHVADGFVQLDYNNGVEVIIESPATFLVADEMRLVLRSGRLSARVSEDGEGFTVETPSADVVDFGTEFAVEVSADRSSEVHVFAGEVEVRPKSQRQRDFETAPDAVRLVSDQATRFDTSNSVPLGIDIDRDRFVRDLVEPAHSYARAVRAYSPVTLLRMGPLVDGRTLDNKGTDKTSAVVYRGTMIRPPFAPGRRGASLRLGGPGSESYAVLPAYPVATENRLTVSVWVQADSRPRWASIAKNWASEAGGQFHLGLFRDDGDVEVHVHDGDGNEVLIREQTPLPLGQWHHIAFVVDGKTLTLYRNGEFVAQASCRGLSTIAPKALGIGVKLNADGTAPATPAPGFWDGRIDELAIVHMALSPSQVRELYESASKFDTVPPADVRSRKTNAQRKP